MIDQSIDLCILWDACHELFCIFGDFYVSVMQDAEVAKSLVAFEQSLKTLVCFCSFCLGVPFEISGQSSYQFNKFPSKSGFHNVIQYRPFLMKKQCYQQVYYFYPRRKSTMIYGSRGPGFLAMPFALFL